MSEHCWVFQEWMGALSMQQQSVLLLACRGPDGIPKYHPCKALVTRYRAAVLKSAYFGRAQNIEEEEGHEFMTLKNTKNAEEWKEKIEAPFFDSIDAIPMHYTMHLFHGCQIVGYKHPHPTFRERFSSVYLKGCEHFHLNPETQEQLDKRLSDWNRKFWR